MDFDALDCEDGGDCGDEEDDEGVDDVLVEAAYVDVCFYRGDLSEAVCDGGHFWEEEGASVDASDGAL